MSKPKEKALDVSLRVTVHGTLQVQMSREELKELEARHPRGSMPLDDVPGVDWHDLVNALDFEAEIEDVFDPAPKRRAKGAKR
jgi:hypothetical protein